MPDENIKVSLDIKDVDSASRAFKTALEANSISVTDWLGELSKFNAQSTSFINALEKISISLKKVYGDTTTLKQGFASLNVTGGLDKVLGQLTNRPQGIIIDTKLADTNILNLGRKALEVGVNFTKLETVGTKAIEKIGLSLEQKKVLQQLGLFKDAFIGIEEASTKSANGILLSWRSIGRLFQALVIRRILSELVSAFHEALTAAIQFELQVTRIAVTTGNSFDALSAKFTALSNASGQSREDIGAAFQKVATSGIGGTKDQFLILNEALKLTTVSGVSTTTTVEDLTRVLNGFKLGADQANRVAEVLFVLSKNNSISFNELGKNTGSLGLVAKDLGISFEDTAATIATMTKQSIDAGRAMNQLNSILTHLAHPSKTDRPAIEDIFGDIKSLIAVEGITGVFKRLSSLSDENIVKLGDLGTKIHDLRGVLALTGENLKLIEDNSRAAHQQLNQLGDASTKVGASTAQSLERSGARFKNYTQNTVSSILPIINFLGEGFVEIFNHTEAALVKNEELRIKQEEQFTKATENEKRENQKRLEDFTKTYDEKTAVIGRFIREVERQEGELTRTLVDQQIQTNDKLKVSLGTLTDQIKAGINDLTKNIDQAQNHIKQTQKLVEGFKTKATEDAFNLKLKFEEDPDLKLNLLKNRINVLTTEATALFKKGDDASIASARIKFQEIEKLQDEFFSTSTAKEKALFEQKVKLGEIAPSKDFLGKDVYRFSVDTAKFDRERNALIQTRIQLEEQYAQKLKEQIAIQEQAKEKEKGRLRTVDEAIKKILDFKPQDKKYEGIEGEKLLKRDTQNVLDAEKILLENIKGNYLEAATIKKDIEKKVYEVIAIEESKKHAKQLANLAEITAKKFEAAKQDVTKISTAKSKNYFVDIEAEIGRVSAQLRDAAGPGAKFIAFLESFSPQGKKDSEAINHLSDALDHLDEVLKKARESGKTGTAAIIPILGALEQLGQPISEFKNAENAKGAILKIDELKKSLQDSIQTQKEVNDNFKNLPDAQKVATDLVKSYIDTLNGEYKNQAKVILDTGLAQGTATKEIIKNLLDIEVPLKDIIRLQQQISPVNSITIGNAGFIGPISGYAEGGVIPNNNIGNSSFSRGTDTVPAMLTPGEFVINADSTRRFYSQLKAINMGIQPKYFANGGPINNTNVGDVNVTVQGSTSEMTVRDIAYALRRELRRGNI